MGCHLSTLSSSCYAQHCLCQSHLLQILQIPLSALSPPSLLFSPLLSLLLSLLSLHFSLFSLFSSLSPLSSLLNNIDHSLLLFTVNFIC